MNSTQLSDVSLKLELTPDDATNFDLQILILQLRKQVVAQAFDPLTTLANSTVEVEQLKLLMPQVDQAIRTEQRRVLLVARHLARENRAPRRGREPGGVISGPNS